MKPVDVCLSPELIHLYDVTDKTVVVVDILRATSCMVTAFAHGVADIKPYADLEQCKAAITSGYETSGERNGEKVEGFTRGNSPFEYMEANIRGKHLAFTTTNGTQAIDKAKQAKALLIGAFLNIQAVATAVQELNHPTLIVCAGWKGRFNLEDTLFAGALIQRLSTAFKPEDDAALAAVELYDRAKANPVEFLQKSSHVQRLARLNIHKDIEFCLTPDVYTAVPELKNDHLTLRR